MGRRSRKKRPTDVREIQCPTGVASGATEPRGVSGQSPGRSGKAEDASSSSGPPFSPSSRETRRFHGWRRRLLRLALLVLSPILFFGLLEAGLRLTGYGYPTGFFLGPDAQGAYRTNDRFGWRFFPPALAREPQASLLSAKPPGTVRIFVLGSSAAMGEPDPSFSFGRILAVMLHEQYPSVQFEVVNAAMTAINSHVTREIARDCAAQAPDLFVVYMGNNEVIGPYGPGTIFQQWSPSLRMVRASLWVKSTRVGQLFGDVVDYFRRQEGTPGRWRGMEMWLDNPVAADDARLTAMYDNYRQNLTDICGIARRARAAVVLSTVAVNLRDCPPLASLHRSNLTAEDLAKWESIYRAGGELEAGDRWDEAFEKYEAAAKIDDRFAELQFRIGHCLTKADRFAEARERFQLARDLDVLRFRADDRINAILREVAGEQEAVNVRLVDAERALAQSNPDSKGILGGDLFYEHVHLTFDGNYLLARAVLDQVCVALPQLATLEKQGAIPSRQQCAELLAMTPCDEYRSADIMVNMTSKAPFTNQFDYSLRQAAAEQRRDALRKQAATPQVILAAKKTYEAALARAPDDWQLHHNFGMLSVKWGQPDVAVKHLRIAVERLPFNTSLPVELGDALTGLGQIDEAVAHFQEALRIQPHFVEAHNNWGNALLSQGRVDEAVAHFQEVLRIKPDDAAAHNNWGNALESQGHFDEAVAHYQEALRIRPNYAMAHNNWGTALQDLGRYQEAAGHFQEALRLQPDYSEAHSNLGNVLRLLGRFDESITHCQEAARLQPELAVAYINWGAALQLSGRIEEAVVQYREALRLKPELAVTHDNLGKALRLLGSFEEAATHWREALRLNPDSMDTRLHLAWLLATCPDAHVRDGPWALDQAQRVSQATGYGNAEVLGTLAAAYAETGNFQEAVRWQMSALLLTPELQRSALEQRLELYRSGKPFREEVQRSKMGNRNEIEGEGN